MRLKKDVQLVDFIKRVKQCSFAVYLETEEGDRLNLNSTLSQYVFVTLSGEEFFLENSRIICSAEDKILLAEFLEN